MNNINLLPRRSRIDKWFIPMLLVNLIIMGALIFTIEWISRDWQSRHQAQIQDIERMNEKVDRLSYRTTSDPLFAEFQLIELDIQHVLISDSQDWNHLLDVLDAERPTGSYIDSLTVGTDQRIHGRILLVSMNEAATYMQSLQRILQTEAQVTSIRRLDDQSLSVSFSVQLPDRGSRVAGDLHE